MATLMQLVDGVVVQKIELNGEVTIGRNPRNTVIIDDTAVSGAHAKITQVPNADFPEFNEYFMQDLGSTNGTEINGAEVSALTKLNHNDQIKIAWNEFKFVDEGQANFEKTVHMIK